MKKEYSTPEVEKVEFNYREQVVASACENIYGLKGSTTCTDESLQEKLL